MFILALLFLPISCASIFSQDAVDTVENMLDSFYPPYNADNSSRGHVPGPSQCPEKLNASWLLRPPFTKLANSSESGDSKKGIFFSALEFALDRCCGKLNGGNNTFISFKTHAAANTSMLHQDIRKDEADLILPAQSDLKNEYKGYLPYLKILDSPGFVLIQRSDSIQRSGVNNVQLLNAIGNCWPIIVITVLLSFAAGMCVWAMETRKNTQEFGSPLYRGVFDGFWWAFVTMSTVGYGDKTPKSMIGRLFSIVWIMIGITICSILTATLSSALTSVTVQKYDVISGKKIGVVRDSIALKKAVNLGVNAKVFEDIDEVYDALVDNQTVDGIIEELFFAIEYMNQKDNSLLSVTHLFEEKHGYGIAFNENAHLPDDIRDCMSKVVILITDDIYVATNQQINEVKKSKIQQPSTNNHANVNAHLQETVIDEKSPVFIGTMIGLCGFVVVFFGFYMTLKYCRGGRFDKYCYHVENGQEQGTSKNSQKPKFKERLECKIAKNNLGAFSFTKKKERNSATKNMPVL